MLGSIWAVTAGFLVMTVLVILGSMVLARLLVPGAMQAMRSGEMTMPPLTTGYLAGNLTLSLAAAVTGGYATLRLAPTSPAGHLLALGLVVLVMGVVSAKSPGSAHQPAWYRVVIPLVGVSGVALAALLA